MLDEYIKNNAKNKNTENDIYIVSHIQTHSEKSDYYVIICFAHKAENVFIYIFMYLASSEWHTSLFMCGMFSVVGRIVDVHACTNYEECLCVVW